MSIKSHTVKVAEPANQFVPPQHSAKSCSLQQHTQINDNDIEQQHQRDTMNKQIIF